MECTCSWDLGWSQLVSSQKRYLNHKDRRNHIEALAQFSHELGAVQNDVASKVCSTDSACHRRWALMSSNPQLVGL